jgi:hypothetical protein
MILAISDSNAAALVEVLTSEAPVMAVVPLDLWPTFVAVLKLDNP